jgi:hypothetical protein
MSDLGPVHCRQHGERRPTFVCKHLVRGSGLGFFSPNRPPAVEEADEQTAWCSDCERVRQEQGGGWDDVSEGYASVTMVCEACFEAARHRNEFGTDG